MGQAKRLWMELEERGDWPSDSLRGKNACSHHFEDKYLKKMVTDKGHQGTCSYCGRKGIVSDIMTSVNRLHGGWVCTLLIRRMLTCNLPSITMMTMMRSSRDSSVLVILFSLRTIRCTSQLKR